MLKANDRKYVMAMQLCLFLIDYSNDDSKLRHVARLSGDSDGRFSCLPGFIASKFRRGKSILTDLAECFSAY